jgi:hypothetical protein
LSKDDFNKFEPATTLSLAHILMKIVHNKHQEPSGTVQLTNDPDFFIKRDKITPALAAFMEQLYTEVTDAKVGVLEKLNQAIVDYPHIPHFWNHMHTFYTIKKDWAKAKHANDQALEKFPDYLFARIIRAFEFLEEGQPEKVANWLGTSFNLSVWYPDRKVFHIAEEMNIQRLAAYYFTDTGDFEAAADRLDIMKQIDPTDSMLEDATSYWLTKFNDHMEVQPDDLDLKHNVRTNPVAKSDKVHPPRFKNALVHEIYNADFNEFIPLIPLFLKLPKKSLTADLEKVLDDSIERYYFFMMSDYTDGDMVDGHLDPDFSPDFLSHAISLLAEIGATQLLPKVLNIFAQSQAFLRYYFDDVIAEFLWLALYKLGASQPYVLKAFMLRPAIYTVSRSAIADVMAQVGHHHPERRNEVLDWFDDVLQFYVKSQPDENVVDSLLIALMIAHLVDLRAKRLLPLIEKLYKRGYVEEDLNGDMKSIRNNIDKPYSDDDYIKWTIRPMEAYYERIAETIEPGLDDVRSFLDGDADNFFAPSKPYVKEVTVGRNDPCPCGSGLKYKKCCL